MTLPALPSPLAAVEAKLTALLDEILGPDTGPGLTGAVRPDGYRCVIVTARRDGRVSSSIVDLDIAATLTDVQLREELIWMVGRTIDELEDDDQYGDS